MVSGLHGSQPKQWIARRSALGTARDWFTATEKPVAGQGPMEQKYAIKLAEIRHEYEALKVKADGLRRDARYEVDQRMRELQRQTDEAETKLDGLRNAGHHAAAEQKAGLEMAFDDLRTGVHSAKQALPGSRRH